MDFREQMFRYVIMNSCWGTQCSQGELVNVLVKKNFHLCWDSWKITNEEDKMTRFHIAEKFIHAILGSVNIYIDKLLNPFEHQAHKQKEM